MDIYPSKLQGLRNVLTEEIEGNALYLCDSKGHLIYANNPLKNGLQKIIFKRKAKDFLKQKNK